ncbi:MAG: hypothetical protein V4538_15715 [Bacteroidota bacterium]
MCETKKCNRKPKQGKYCYTCIKRKYKAKHPERYAYSVTKNNAKRRGKPFTISFEYFLKFCVKTNYIAGKGITKHGLHIDRIKEHLGYVPGNIQAKENTDNIKKYLTYNYDKYGKPFDYKIYKSLIVNNDNDPF